MKKNLVPTVRKIELKDALKAVDDWLKSDDVWVCDVDGDPVHKGTVNCVKGSLMHRFIEKMTK